MRKNDLQARTSQTGEGSLRLRQSSVGAQGRLFEVFNGFKETKIGPIPVEWDVVRLHKVVVKTETRDPRQAPNHTFKYIDVSSVSNETHRVQGWKEYQGHNAPSRARKVVRAGDTIFATVRPYLRNIARIPNYLDNDICSTGFCVIRAEPGKADPDYLYYVALTDSFVDRVVEQQRGSSYPAVSDKVVYEQPIPLPPLPEQRRIAAVLSAIQRAIAVQDDIIAAGRELKRSLMHRLFTYGPGREPAETKETEIGEIPARWEVHTVGELCDRDGGLVQTGPFGSQLHASDYVDVGIPTVMPKDIVDNRISTTSIARISDHDHKRLSKYHLRSGDIVYARRGDIGRRALIKEEHDGWLCGTGSMFLRVSNPRIEPEYLYFYLGRSEVNAFIRSHAIGTTMLNLNSTILRSVPVAHPDRNEQQQVAHTLAAADSKIVVELDCKAALQQLFRSALHELMTGRIRLLSDEGLPIQQPVVQ